jgi:hypothetical protein
VDEKRVCLGNVLLINPQNQRAQQMLDRLEGRTSAPAQTTSTSFTFEESAATPAARSGPQRQNLLAGGLIILGLIVAGVLFVTISGGGGVTVPTAFVSATPTFTPDVPASQTAQASITPTATISPTPTAAQLGAVWTNTPAPTTTTTPEPLPPPPADLPGRVIMQSGRVVGDSSNQPAVVMPAGNPAGRQVVSGPDERGQLPSMTSGSTQFVWAEYLPSTRLLSMQVQTFGAATITDINLITNNTPPLLNPNYADWQGNLIVLSAATTGESDRELWLLSPSGQPIQTTASSALLPPIEDVVNEGPAPAPQEAGSPLLRLTNDGANNIWSNFDPTGTAVVYVAEEDGLTELRVINTGSLQIFSLTDNGNALVESAPDWGPGNEIVFSASVEGSDASDIYLMPADGSAEPTLLFDFGLHDIQPRFSPDGRFIVFSTDRAGDWDVVIYARETQEFYGLETNPETIDIANGWTD